MEQNPDYTFMKTGFDIVNNDEPNDSIINNITVMVTSFADCALRSSALYVQHSKRNTITPEDLKRCMMLETFLYTKRPDILQRCKEIKDRLFSSDDENDVENNVDEQEEEEDDKFEESKCKCVLCQNINNIYTKWEGWTPQNQIELILKGAIEKIA